MTRKSKREIETTVAELEADESDLSEEFTVCRVCSNEFADPDTDFVIRNREVMLRESAERDGREILEPCEDAPSDAVYVAHE